MLQYLKPIFIFISIIFVLNISCADNEQPEPKRTIFIPKLVPVIGKVMTIEEYEKKCIRHEWYFCDLNGGERMMVTKDICQDPPAVLEVGECVEFLECDPTNYNMGTIDCITIDGFPGTQDQVCDKGKIKFTDCVTLCSEEICDYEDNDCDGFIDEGQLNACGECGFVPEDTCDGVDNDCDSSIDEDLIQECSTACGVGVEYCIGGDWASCTAPPVQIEICDGFDNDCDGKIDEELKCECTIDHVGALFPCNEAPLLCGQGYKTCECSDSDCTEIYTTDCVAPCVYFPEPDEICEPTIGMPLELEECNNFDDNCNQLIDEDLYVQCYSGDPDTLYIGICEPGIMTCLAGTWGNYWGSAPEEPENFLTGFCKDEVVPQEEICNGIDDDCDGVTDSGEELQPVDIMFIVDWSGSMDTEIIAVMTALNKFAGNYSDEEVLQWGIILGPLESFNGPYAEYLKLHHNLSGFTDFLASMAQLNVNAYGMSGAREMLMDALYLAMHNLVGSGALPIKIADLSWNIMKGVAESNPALLDFKVDWRTETDVERVIILFTDETPQTFLDPKIEQDILLQLISKTSNTKIYIFSKHWHKEDSTYHAGWEPLCTASGGKWFELTDDMLTVYNSLMEIIDENACN
mgnify:CR=1 FL=1